MILVTFPEETTTKHAFPFWIFWDPKQRIGFRGMWGPRTWRFSAFWGFLKIVTATLLLFDRNGIYKNATETFHGEKY